VQLWNASDSVDQSFGDVEALAAACHFGDCRHREEPRCAVKAAVGEGRLVPARLASYLALQDELQSLAARHDERLRLETKRTARTATRALEARLRSKYRA
jgi:ribosome biogenesis GTPase